MEKEKFNIEKTDKNFEDSSLEHNNFIKKRKRIFRFFQKF